MRESLLLVYWPRLRLTPYSSVDKTLLTEPSWVLSLPVATRAVATRRTCLGFVPAISILIFAQGSLWWTGSYVDLHVVLQLDRTPCACDAEDVSAWKVQIRWVFGVCTILVLGVVTLTHPLQ